MSKKMLYLTTVLMMIFTCNAQADLILHWTLDGGDVAVDASGNGRDGTIAGTPDYVPGMVKQALDLDGSSDSITLEETIVTGNSAVALWLMPRNLPYSTDYRSIFHDRQWNTGSIHGHLRANTSLINFDANGGGGVTATTVCENDEWYHTLVTYNLEASEVKLYINGVLEATGGGLTSSVYIGPLTFGAWNSNRYFDGVMDDIRIYDHTVTEAEVPVIMAGTAIELASDPSPAEEQADVRREVTLAWAPGEYAAKHNIYLSESFADVNDGSTAALVGDSIDPTTLDAGVLNFGATYFWRVDEVNSAPDRTVFSGEVWSFTVEPLAIPVETITATASGANAEMGPEKTIDGSGLNDMDEHSTSPQDMWLAMSPDSWIQYEFDKAYKLHEMLIWNSNQVIEAFIGFGVKEATIETSLDGEIWTAIDGVGELAKATGAPNYGANNAVAMGGVMAKYVKLTPVSAHGFTGQSGLSEVRFLAIPVAAREPMPADGATAATATVDLGWRSGREAVSHEVYLGTDAENMTLMDTTNSATAVTDPLDYETTYFWSVTEVNDTADPTAHAGDLWTFTTPEFGTVDNFESYSGNEGEEVYMAWFDGFGGDAALGGSTTGHIDGPFVETSIVNSGDQSLPFYYDNDGGFSDIDGKSTSPNFSEVVRELDSQDWTASGLKTLSLMFHGVAGNAGTLYVKINNTKVVYQGNAINIARPAWQVWNIELATTGANLNKVNTLAIGVDGGGVAGILYIDDIRLYPIVFDVTATDITTPGDTVLGLPNDDDWPAAESPDLAIDGDTSTKYLHRKGGSMPTGFQVTPVVGSTVVTELTLTTANDAPNRDPITFELSGSNVGIDGPYELIASGDVVDFAGATEWPRFTQNETTIEINNNVAYTHYQIVFPTLRGANEALMQIAEVELIGSIQ